MTTISLTESEKMSVIVALVDSHESPSDQVNILNFLNKLYKYSTLRSTKAIIKRYIDKYIKNHNILQIEVYNKK